MDKIIRHSHIEGNAVPDSFACSVPEPCREVPRVFLTENPALSQVVFSNQILFHSSLPIFRESLEAVWERFDIFEWGNIPKIKFRMPEQGTNTILPDGVTDTRTSINALVNNGLGNEAVHTSHDTYAYMSYTTQDITFQQRRESVKASSVESSRQITLALSSLFLDSETKDLEWDALDSLLHLYTADSLNMLIAAGWNLTGIVSAVEADLDIDMMLAMKVDNLL